MPDLSFLLLKKAQGFRIFKVIRVSGLGFGAGLKPHDRNLRPAIEAC